MSGEVVIRTRERATRPWTLLVTVAKEVAHSRHLAFELMKRDLRSQWRTSITGMLIPLLPALTTAAWAVLFRDAHLINVGAVRMPYPFFVLCGMMLWAAFLEALDAPISGVMAEQGLLSKARIAPEVVAVAKLGQVLVNFVVKAMLLAVAAALYRVHVPWTCVLAPFGLLMILLLGASIGLILAPLNLLYVDIAKVVPVVTAFWFFVTPIIYLAPSSGVAAFVMRHVNPMSPLLTTTRELAFGSELTQLRGFEVMSVVTVVLFLLASLFHRIAMPIVIDRANA